MHDGFTGTVNVTVYRAAVLVVSVWKQRQRAIRHPESARSSGSDGHPVERRGWGWGWWWLWGAREEPDDGWCFLFFILRGAWRTSSGGPGDSGASQPGPESPKRPNSGCAWSSWMTANARSRWRYVCQKTCVFICARASLFDHYFFLH